MAGELDPDLPEPTLSALAPADAEHHLWPGLLLAAAPSRGRHAQAREGRAGHGPLGLEVRVAGEEVPPLAVLDQHPDRAGDVPGEVEGDRDLLAAPPDDARGAQRHGRARVLDALAR